MQITIMYLGSDLELFEMRMHQESMPLCGLLPAAESLGLDELLVQMQHKTGLLGKLEVRR